jgi:hypothetical protein
VAGWGGGRHGSEEERRTGGELRIRSLSRFSLEQDVNEPVRLSLLAGPPMRPDPSVSNPSGKARGKKCFYPIQRLQAKVGDRNYCSRQIGWRTKVCPRRCLG